MPCCIEFYTKDPTAVYDRIKKEYEAEFAEELGLKKQEYLPGQVLKLSYVYVPQEEWDELKAERDKLKEASKKWGEEVWGKSIPDNLKEETPDFNYRPLFPSIGSMLNEVEKIEAERDELKEKLRESELSYFIPAQGLRELALKAENKELEDKLEAANIKSSLQLLDLDKEIEELQEENTRYRDAPTDHWIEVQEYARKEFSPGVCYWPDAILKLLKEYKELKKDPLSLAGENMRLKDTLAATGSKVKCYKCGRYISLAEMGVYKEDGIFSIPPQQRVEEFCGCLKSKVYVGIPPEVQETIDGLRAENERLEKDRIYKIQLRRLQRALWQYFGYGTAGETAEESADRIVGIIRDHHDYKDATVVDALKKRVAGLEEELEELNKNKGNNLLAGAIIDDQRDKLLEKGKRIAGLEGSNEALERQNIEWKKENKELKEENVRLRFTGFGHEKKEPEICTACGGLKLKGCNCDKSKPKGTEEIKECLIAMNEEHGYFDMPPEAQTIIDTLRAENKQLKQANSAIGKEYDKLKGNINERKKRL
jgi:hypothetical protein